MHILCSYLVVCFSFVVLSMDATSKKGGDDDDDDEEDDDDESIPME